MSLNILRSNLHELYVADKGKSKILVSDLSGTYIYSAKSGWGIFWSWIFGIADLIGLDDLKKTSFEKAMVHTHRLFKFHLDEVVEASTKYQKTLENFINQDNFGSLSKVRQTLCNWNRAVKPFIKYINSCVHPTIANEISIGFINQMGSNYKSPFSEGKYSAQINHQHQIIKLEGILNFPLPLNVIFKAAQKQILSKSEQKILKSFVRKLNRNEKTIGIRFLHKVLKTVLLNGNEVFQDKSKGHPNITALEIALVNLKCSILLQKDAKHIANRDRLSPGDKVICNGREIVLGERLGNSTKLEDQNVIFATDDPKIVLSIGINPLIHSLKREIINDESWGIKSAEYIDVDEENGFALIERLHGSLGSHQWASDSYQLHPSDEQVVAPLGILLHWFLKQNKTPINFSPKYLMFDHQNHLKCLKVALKDDFDFNALEQFAFECSAGNRYIFHYLMEKSQLNKHLFARYYENMLAYTLNGEKHDAADVAASMGIIDKRIVQRGRDLAKEAIEMRDRCCVKIKSEGHTGGIEEINKQISEELIARYRELKAAGLLPAILAKR